MATLGGGVSGWRPVYGPPRGGTSRAVAPAFTRRGTSRFRNFLAACCPGRLRQAHDEALERYLSERRIFRPADVHAKIAKGLESVRHRNGMDGETAMADLQAELAAP